MALTRIRDLRRKELLDAALASMKRKGLDGVTVSSIARECGASKGSVHHYFKSKRILILTALRYAHALRREEIIKRLRAARTPQERIAAIIDVNLGETFFNYEYYSLWNSLIVRALNDCEFSRLLKAIRQRERSTLIHALRQILSQGEAITVLLMIRAMIEGFRRWAGTTEWYANVQALPLAYASLSRVVPGFRKTPKRNERPI